MGGGGGMEELTEDEKRALRGSKFAPLTSLPSSSRSQLPRFLFHFLRAFLLLLDFSRL